MRNKFIVFVFSLNLYCVTLTAQKIVSVDFSKEQIPVPPEMFGVNIFAGMAPSVAQEPTYVAKMESLNLPIVRYHSAQILDQNHPRSWVNFETQWWDTTKIEAALASLDGKVGARMINIYNFPEWLQNLNSGTASKRLLDKSKVDEYANFCAGLVSIVNKHLGLYTQYWEPFNEIEDEFADAGETQFLIDIYNAVAIKMRAVDPTIQIGGPAIQNPYWNDSEQTKWFEGTKEELDFVSVHAYGVGNSAIPNNEIYEKAEGVVTGAERIRGLMNNAGLPADLPLFLDEYNIVWTFTGDSQGKMRGAVGAVFDAIILKKAVEGGKINSLMSWNERDGTYGKLSGENVERPAYRVLELSNKLLNGATVESNTFNNKEVMVMATKSATQRTLMIINRSENEHVIALNLGGISLNADTKYKYHFIGNEYYTSVAKIADQPLTQLVLPASSVHFIDFDFTESAITAPSINIISPTKNNRDYISPSNVLIKVESEDDESVEKVEFFNGNNKLGEDSSAPYEFLWRNVPKGSYNIQIISTDKAGNRNSSILRKLDLSFNGGGDYGNYTDFSSDTDNSFEAITFSKGNSVYTDEESSFVEVPFFFEGIVLSQIPTYNSNKNLTSEDHLSFESLEENYVLVAYPVGVTTLPNWLSIFTNLADTIISSSGQRYNLYAKFYTSKKITLGAAKAAGFEGDGNLPNYMIFLVSNLPDTEPPTTPQNLSFEFGNNNVVFLSWDPSTDNIKVDRYQVKQNGNVLRSIADTSITIIANIGDVIAVSARDINGNMSPPAEVQIESIVLGNSTLDETLKIFPNPASAKVLLYSTKVIQEISVISTTGAEVLSNKTFAVGTNLYTVNIASLPQGIYVFKIVRSGDIQTVRILKKI